MEGQLREWKDYGYFPGMSVNYGGEYWNIYGSYKYYQFTGHNKTLTTSEIADAQGNPVLFHKDDFLSDYLLKEMDYRLGTMLTLGKNNKHTFGVEFSGTRDIKFHFVNTNTLWKKDYEKQMEDQGINDMINERPSFNYTAALSWKWNLDTSGSYLRIIGNYFKMRSHVNTTQNAIYEHTSDWNSNETDRTRSDTKSYNIQTDILKAIGSWKLRGGVKYTQTRRNNHSVYILPNSNTNYIINYHEQITAGYASVSRNIRKIDLTAGIRAENTDTRHRENNGQKISRNYWNILPDFSFLHHLDEDWSYGLTYNMALTRPSFSNLSKGTVRYNDYSYSIGNPDLRAYTTHKGELDINYRQHSFSVEYKQAKDMITYMIVKADNRAMYEQFRNTGNYREWDISYNYTGNVFSWWNLNLFTQAAHLNYPQNYRYTHQWTGFITVNSRFIAGRYGNFSLSLQSVIGNLTSNSKMTRNYTTVGVAYSHSLLNKRLNIRLAVNDLFHRFRQDYTDYYPTYTIAKHGVYPTRILSLRLTYTFTGKHKAQDANVDQDSSIRSRM